MSTIIAGRFESAQRAEDVVGVLASHGIARTDVTVFYVTPAGQHDATPIGGDEEESAGTENAHLGAGAGATLIGAGAGAAGALIGATAGLAAPMVAVAGLAAAAAGAYSGSLAGAMSATTDAGVHHIRHAGMLVAVNADGADESAIIDALRQGGAKDIERATGTWADGDWENFDPTAPPKLIDVPPTTA